MRKSFLFGLLVILALLIFWVTSQPLPLDIPIVNPGFEIGTQGWIIDTRFQKMFSIDETEKRNGNVSLKIIDSMGTSNPFCSQLVTNLRGNATYRLHAWVKSEKGLSAQAALKIEYYNDGGKNTSGHYGQVTTNLDSSWQTIEVIAKADADTTRANIILRLFGKGIVYFDEVGFAMVKAPPLLLISQSRVALPPLSQKDITLQIRPEKSVISELQPVFTFEIQRLGSPNVTPIKADLKARGEEVWEAMIHLPALQPGQYNLRCSLTKSQVAEDVYLFVPPKERKPKSLSDTGTILVGGKPFFPIGLEHVSPAEYKILMDQGFNSVQGLSTLNLKDFGDSLAAAQKAGIMVDVPLYTSGQVMKNMENSLQKIRMFGSHGNILNWKIIDEPDRSPELIDEVPVAYEQLKQADLRCPIVLTIDNADRYNYWANFCDILQIDPYPIPANPLTMVSDYTAKAKTALHSWQNLTVILQCGWKSNPMNQPTYDQARCMLYLALINGAKGIFWYSMHDPGWDLTKTPLWNRFKEINKETRELSDPIMLGTQVKVKGITPPLEGLCLKYNGKVFLLLANPESNLVDATIEIPVEIGKAVVRSGKEVELRGNSVKLRIAGPGAELVLIDEK